MRVDPARIETLKAEIIVKKYIRPEWVGSLILPEQSREDKTGQIWEVVKSNDKADEVLGQILSVGDILKVRWGRTTELGVEDPEDGRKMFLIKAEDVYHCIKNTWGEG